MRLLMISLGVTFTFFLGLLSIRVWSLSLPTYRFENPVFEPEQTSKQSYKIESYESLEQAKKAVQENSTILLWLNLHVSLDNEFLVEPSSHFSPDVKSKSLDKRIYEFKQTKQFKGKFTFNYGTKELLGLDPSLIPLKSVLSELPNTRFIFNILDNANDIHKQIVTIINEYKLDNRVIIQSPIDIVIKTIKEEKPMMAFGSSYPEIMRLKTFSSIGLEPAVSTKGDIFISQLRISNRQMLNERIVKEIKRRQKRVFIGPVYGQIELQEAISYQPDGIIIGSTN